MDTSARAILQRSYQYVENVPAIFQSYLRQGDVPSLYRTELQNQNNNTRKCQDNGHLSMTHSLSI
jgi:hypothetical protein